MVMKGQFLERPTLIPVGKLVLEGLWHRGDRRPPLLIVPPPPEEGSGMDHVVAAELAWAVATAGHPTLRFNFRGVGASQGQRGDGRAQREDVEAALRVLLENTEAARCAVAGIGGSGTQLLAVAQSHPGLAGLCFVSPRGLDAAKVARLSLPVLAVAAEHDDPATRGPLAAAVTTAGGKVEIIDEADATFTRNLPQVGRAVAQWLGFIK